MRRAVVPDYAEWLPHGLCSETGLTDLFYPEGSHGHQLADTYLRARTLCAQCPVQNECLEAAIVSGEVNFGIWGGYSPRDRRRIAAGGPPSNPLAGACERCGWGECRCIAGKTLTRPVIHRSGPRVRAISRVK